MPETKSLSWSSLFQVRALQALFFFGEGVLVFCTLSSKTSNLFLLAWMTGIRIQLRADRVKEGSGSFIGTKVSFVDMLIYVKQAGSKLNFKLGPASRKTPGWEHVAHEEVSKIGFGPCNQEIDPWVMLCR